MTLKIFSAEDILYNGEVTMVTLPGAMGSFTVLKNHASLISTLVNGTIRFTDSVGQVENIDIQKGIVDVNNNIISVCIY
ncbi:MAG: F0F1 ATP synthase subunit epsilon [Bacteroides sp.]|nr:F0F1 ATP synthase subunit epsilon [Bacteroides sp.]